MRCHNVARSGQAPLLLIKWWRFHGPKLGIGAVDAEKSSAVDCYASTLNMLARRLN